MAVIQITQAPAIIKALVPVKAFVTSFPPFFEIKVPANGIKNAKAKITHIKVVSLIFCSFLSQIVTKKRDLENRNLLYYDKTFKLIVSVYNTFI